MLTYMALLPWLSSRLLEGSLLLAFKQGLCQYGAQVKGGTLHSHNYAGKVSRVHGEKSKGVFMEFGRRYGLYGAFDLRLPRFDLRSILCDLLKLDLAYHHKAFEAMNGDRAAICEEHTRKGHIRAACRIAEILLPLITGVSTRFIIAIAGESGSGKSQIASELRRQLEKAGQKSLVVQQDDYFVHPPMSNAAMRRNDLSHVGVSEVRLGFLDQNLKEIRGGCNSATKPLVVFNENLISEEVLCLADTKVVIVEGTYVMTLRNVDQYVFIDRTYVETKHGRERRAREAQDKHLERVLEIEHSIIELHRELANLIVTRHYDVENYDWHKTE